MTAHVHPSDVPESASTSLTLDGIRLSTRTMPALGNLRGGDWCEAFAVSEHVIALSIGDVCGHGPACFQQMVSLRQILRAAAHCGLDPTRALVEAARSLAGEPQDSYATAIFALLDSLRRTVSFANAGHPPPLVVGPNESCFLDFPSKDRPLGLALDIPPALHVVKLALDTLIVLYTDGVTERDRDLFGVKDNTWRPITVCRLRRDGAEFQTNILGDDRGSNLAIWPKPHRPLIVAAPGDRRRLGPGFPSASTVATTKPTSGITWLSIQLKFPAQ
ncbi:MAG: PP2C family protein-serine/threonine phosphatase [Candidatus Baltobacteraceae bacterium]